MSALGKFMAAQPIFTLFLCLFLGYLLGMLKFGKSFKLGNVVGVLIVGLIIGQIVVWPQKQTAVLGSIFFDAFMFAVGYRVGPQFISSLKKFGAKVVIESFVFLILAFLTSWVCFIIFHVKPGVAAGIVAGALTQSAVIGSSQTTIANLPVSSATKALYNSQVPIVYALTYVFGTIGVLIFLRDIAPKMLGIDIRTQATKVARQLNFDNSTASLTRIRAYKLNKDSQLVGMDIEKANATVPGVMVTSLFDGDDPLEAGKTLAAGNTVVLAGYVNDFDAVRVHELGLSETQLPLLAPKERKFVLSDGYSKSMLDTLKKNHVFVNTYDTAANEMKNADSLGAGAVISFVGNTSASEVASALKSAGRWRASDAAINYGTFSIGLSLAAVLGLLGFKVNGIMLTLGGGTASLFMGLILSIWSDRHQYINSINDGVAEYFQNYGLMLFIANVALGAARTFTSAFQTLGISVFLIGAIISIVPHILSLYVGKYLLHMEPISLLGSLSGADTLSAALNEIAERSGAIGGPYFSATFTVAYVFGNILLTLYGPIFLVLLS